MTNTCPATNAESQRRHRQRERAGRCLLTIEVDEVAIVAMLIDCGLLAADRADDRTAIEAAVAEQLRLLARLPR